jgi:hypothetical protein
MAARMTCPPRDSSCIRGDVEHTATVLEDVLAVEAFSLVREDFLPVGAEVAAGPDPRTRVLAPGARVFCTWRPRPELP